MHSSILCAGSLYICGATLVKMILLCTVCRTLNNFILFLPKFREFLGLDLGLAGRNQATWLLHNGSFLLQVKFYKLTTSFSMILLFKNATPADHIKHHYSYFPQSPSNHLRLSLLLWWNCLQACLKICAEQENH